MVKRTDIGRTAGKTTPPFRAEVHPTPSKKEKDARALIHAHQKNKRRMRGQKTEDEQESIGVTITKELTKDGRTTTRLVALKNKRGHDRIEKLAASVGSDFVDDFLKDCDAEQVKSNLSSLFDDD